MLLSNHGSALGWPEHVPEECFRQEGLSATATLKQTGGIVSGPKGAAARLGIKRSTLHFRMKKLGIVRSFDAKSGLGQVDEGSPSFAWSIPNTVLARPQEAANRKGRLKS